MALVADVAKRLLASSWKSIRGGKITKLKEYLKSMRKKSDATRKTYAFA
jgi:hypothetical protein